MTKQMQVSWVKVAGVFRVNCEKRCCVSTQPQVTEMKQEKHTIGGH